VLENLECGIKCAILIIYNAFAGQRKERMPEKLKQVIYTYSIPLLVLSVALALSLLAASCAALDQGGIVNRDPPTKKKPAVIDLRVYLASGFNVTSSNPICVIIYTNIEGSTNRNFPMPDANDQDNSADSAASTEQHFYIYTLATAISAAMPKSSKAASSSKNAAGGSSSAHSAYSASTTSSENNKWNNLSKLYVAKTVSTFTNSVFYLLAWHDLNGDGILSKGENYIGYNNQIFYHALTESRAYASYTNTISFLLEETYSYQTGSVKITVKYTGDEDITGKKLNASLHKSRNFDADDPEDYMSPRFSKIKPPEYTFIFSGIDDPTVYIRVWLSDDATYHKGVDPVSLYAGPGLGANVVADAAQIKIYPDIATYQSFTMNFEGDSASLSIF
jgi:hypothetical protein